MYLYVFKERIYFRSSSLERVKVLLRIDSFSLISNLIRTFFKKKIELHILFSLKKQVTVQKTYFHQVLKLIARILKNFKHISLSSVYIIQNKARQQNWNNVLKVDTPK